jgi:ankyrin repeat protein
MSELDVEGRSLLHYAAMKDDVGQARALVAQGADLTGRNRVGFTPLHFAAQEGAVHVAEVLLEEGAEVDATNASVTTPLFGRTRGQVLRCHIVRVRTQMMWQCKT